MKKALYFGSFNPIHYGHVAIAEFLAGEPDIDEVVLIVSPKNPIKDASQLEDPMDRFQRVKREIEKMNLHEKIHVSDIEFHLPSPLYSIQTLREIRRREPQDEHILVIGEDNVGILEKWYCWQDILREFEVWVYPRPGYDYREKCTEYAALEGTRGIRFLSEAPQNDISSTQIRNAAKNR